MACPRRVDTIKAQGTDSQPLGIACAPSRIAQEDDSDEEQLFWEQTGGFFYETTAVSRSVKSATSWGG